MTKPRDNEVLIGIIRVHLWLEQKFTGQDGQPRIKVVWM